MTNRKRDTSPGAAANLVSLAVAAEEFGISVKTL